MGPVFGQLDNTTFGYRWLCLSLGAFLEGSSTTYSSSKVHPPSTRKTSDWEDGDTRISPAMMKKYNQWLDERDVLARSVNT